MHICVSAHRHALCSGPRYTDCVCTLSSTERYAVTMLTDMPTCIEMVRASFAHLHGNGACTRTCIQTYTHGSTYMTRDWADSHSWFVNMRSVGGHIKAGFMHACRHNSSYARVSGDWAFFISGLEIYTWKVCTHVQGSGLLIHMAYAMHLASLHCSHGLQADAHGWTRVPILCCCVAV